MEYTSECLLGPSICGLNGLLFSAHLSLSRLLLQVRQEKQGKRGKEKSNGKTVIGKRKRREKREGKEKKKEIDKRN